ncbi:MAG: hypothetical protein WC378_04300 [Opitutaceae bacterium]|jgi:hypothetical protein
MGLLSKFKASQELVRFERHEFLPLLNYRIRNFDSEEHYVRYSSLWKQILTTHGQPNLAEHGADTLVKYFAILEPNASAQLLCYTLAAYIIPGFNELPAYRFLTDAMEAFWKTELSDQGVDFDSRLRLSNPKSAEAFVIKHGYTAFNPKLRQEVMGLAAKLSSL